MTTATLPRRSQKSYQYDVYGEVTGGSGSLANEFDFAGQQTDGTGLQYLRARYYDPDTGTFLSRDPLAAQPTWIEGPHAYAQSSPSNFTDPTGLCIGGLWCPDIVESVENVASGACVLNILLCWAAQSAADDIKTKLLASCEFLGACVFGSTWEVNGVRFWEGKAGQKEAWRHYKKMGQPEYVSTNKLHALKRKFKIGADEDLTFDSNGDVYRSAVVKGKDAKGNEVTTRFYEKLGNILDNSCGTGRK